MTSFDSFPGVLIYCPDSQGMVDDLLFLIEDAHQQGKQAGLVLSPVASMLLRDAHDLGADASFVSEGEMPTREEALLIHGKATYLSELLQAYGYEQENVQFIDTLRILLPEDVDRTEFLASAREWEVQLREAEGSDALLLTITRESDLDEINNLIRFFAEYMGGMAPEVVDESEFEGLWSLDEELAYEPEC